MSFIAPIFTSLGGLGGAAGAAGGMGGFGMIGSLISAVGSFMGQSTPDVPTPPAVSIAPGTAAPELKPADTPASLLTQDQKDQMQLDEKRRRLLANNKSSANTNNLTKGNVDTALTDKPLILG